MIDVESRIRELESQVQQLRSQVTGGPQGLAMWPSGTQPGLTAVYSPLPQAGWMLRRKGATTLVVMPNHVDGLKSGAIMIDGKLWPVTSVGASAGGTEFTPALAASGAQKTYMLLLQDKHEDSPAPTAHTVTLELVAITNQLTQFQRKITGGYRYRYLPLYRIVVSDTRIVWGGTTWDTMPNTIDARGFSRWDTNTWEEPVTQTVTVVTSIDPAAVKTLTFKSGRLATVA